MSAPLKVGLQLKTKAGTFRIWLKAVPEFRLPLFQIAARRINALSGRGALLFYSIHSSGLLISKENRSAR